jgi:glutamate/tyrosine decarboxylase-like PLP-dependent enzyme
LFQALVGIGSDNCVDVAVDNNGRVEIAELRKKLDECLANKQAVYALVAIIGSTEEGVVDPLDEVIKLRDEYAEKGLSFIVHADAAWGGYFASMIRDPPKNARSRWDDQVDEEGSRDFVPSITLRDSTTNQFHALANTDSITIDPHKAGYIPYPAGGLCYRDGRMRFLLTWTAPYLHQSDTGESIGVYGIEDR